MSGICGIVHWNEPPPEQDRVRPMLDAAPHRGPDGIYSRTEGPASFGYLSLEITPESEGEVQPLVHSPTGVMLVADLRLDNRDELINRIGKESVERHRMEISARGRTPGKGPPTDADGELQETKHWIRTARACGYVSEKENDEWISDARQIGAMLGSMIVQHDRFTLSK